MVTNCRAAATLLIQTTPMCFCFRQTSVIGIGCHPYTSEVFVAPSDLYQQRALDAPAPAAAPEDEML